MIVVQVLYEIGKQVYRANLIQNQDLSKESGEGQFHSIDILKENMPDLENLKFLSLKMHEV